MEIPADQKWAAALIELRELNERLQPIISTILESLSQGEWPDGDYVVGDRAFDDDEESEETLDLHAVIELVGKQNEFIEEVYSVFGHATNRLLQGEPLTLHEFYLLRAGVSFLPTHGHFPELTKAIGRDWFDECDLYRLLYYADDTRKGLIYPEIYLKSNLAFKVTPIRPTDVKKSRLRDDQLLFFETHFPAEFALFEE